MNEAELSSHNKKELNVKVPMWEGPLDLLLDLIRSAKVNIYDIPIADITRQYMETLQLMKDMDLEVAGEFLVMASQLLLIKSRMLLPVEFGEEGDDMERDPRDGLVSQLLEYQKFKKMADVLESREQITERIIERSDHQITFLEKPEESEDDMWSEVTLFELIKIFSGVVDVVQFEGMDVLREEDYKVEDKIEYIQMVLEEKGKINFYDLFSKKTPKIEVVVTFWALLELYKMGSILFKQHSFFSDIYIFRRPGKEELQEIAG